MTEIDQRPSFRNWSVGGDFIALAILAALMFVVANYSDLERGMTAACSGFAIVVVARVFAYLRAHAWFWMLLGIFVLLHVLVVIYAPWARNSYPGIVIMPIGMADFGIMYLVVRLAERRLK